MNRALLSAGRLVVARQSGAQAFRGVHKGIESVPPMRWMSVPERIGLYFAISLTFLSYPTYLMYSLDNIRPKGENSLGESALEEKERRAAARA
uniref:Cytochrome c oxidase polypeptide VIIc n=1 Tax=Panagrellus redivivus TaxID=6233 RepID=A0A7E4W5U6_PANRE